MVLKHLNPQSWSHLLVHSAQVEPVAFHVGLLQPTHLMGIVGEVFQEQGQGQVRVVHLMQRPYPHSTATSMLLAVDWLALAIPVTHIALATFLHGSLSSLVQSHSGGLVLEPGQQGIHSQPIQSIAKMGYPAHQKNWRDYPVHSSPKKTGGTIQSTVHQKNPGRTIQSTVPKKKTKTVHSSPQKNLEGLSSPQFPPKKPGGTIQSTVPPKKTWRDYPVHSSPEKNLEGLCSPQFPKKTGGTIQSTVHSSFFLAHAFCLLLFATTSPAAFASRPAPQTTSFQPSTCSKPQLPVPGYASSLWGSWFAGAACHQITSRPWHQSSCRP